MKIKLKLVAAAVALVVSGQATAAYAPGELMLTVWDKAGQQSYTRDLGVNVASIVANPSAFSLNIDLATDSNYAGFLGLPAGNSSAATWSIVASNSLVAPTPALWGTVLTSALGTGVPSVSTTPSLQPTYAGIIGDQSLWFNATSEVRTVGQTGYAGATTWGDNLSGGVLTVAGAIGSLDLTLIGFDASFNSVVTNLGPVSLSSAGLLATGAAPAPVPVPAAAWLLGSALIGMAGMARRRDDEVAAA